MSEVVGVILLILLVLAIPVISIAALVMALNARDGIRRLALRIAALEATLAGQPGLGAITEPAPAAAVQTAEPAPVIMEPAAAPETPEPEPAASATPAP